MLVKLHKEKGIFPVVKVGHHSIFVTFSRIIFIRCPSPRPAIFCGNIFGVVVRDQSMSLSLNINLFLPSSIKEILDGNIISHLVTPLEEKITLYSLSFND